MPSPRSRSPVQPASWRSAPTPRTTPPSSPRNESDFVSLDGTNDRDAYAFTLTADAELTLQLDPRGPIYSEGAQGGAQSLFDTKALSDLALNLLASDGSVLGVSNDTGAGFGESITQVLSAGDYFALVRSGAGAEDNVQLYELNISAVLIPEPSGVLLLAGATGLMLRRRVAA